MFDQWSPYSSRWKLIVVDRLVVHLGGKARRSGSGIATVDNPYWTYEVLVQVVHILDGAILHVAGNGEKIGHGKVLNQLAKTDAAGMREDAYSKFCRH